MARTENSSRCAFIKAYFTRGPLRSTPWPFLRYRVYDGDERGRVGTQSSLPILAKRLFVRTVALGDGIKPDTMSEDI